MDAILIRKAALALVALVVANLVLTAGLFRTDRAEGFIGLLLFVAFGTALSQILLLAVWLTCAEGSWFRRFGVPVLLTACIGYAAALGLRIEPLALIVFPLVFQVPLFALAALLWPICRMRGWRLSASAATVEVQPNQFRIGDVLAWMTIIGVLLALVRLPFMSRGGVGSGIWVLLAFVVLPAPLLWAALLISLSVRPRLSWWLVLQFLGLLIYAPVAFTICARLLYDALIDMPGPPGFVLLRQSLALTTLLFVGVPFLLSLNCLVFRALGWRLIRPASRGRLSASAVQVRTLSNPDHSVT